MCDAEESGQNCTKTHVAPCRSRCDFWTQYPPTICIEELVAYYDCMSRIEYVCSLWVEPKQAGPCQAESDAALACLG